jgi:hypothetical protein
MNAVHIRKTIDSETMYLHEIKRQVGRTVDMIVLEDDTRSTIQPGTGDWEAGEKAAREVGESGCDFDA